VTLPKKMPHLRGAKKLVGHPGQKLCVHESAAFVLDVPGAVLCIGTFRASTPEEIAATPNASPVPFIHAWAEWGGLVWSPTAMRTCSPDAYYAANGARDIKRLPRPVLLKIAREIDLSRHLRLGYPTRDNASVSGALLQAAGVPYRIENHAILPAESGA
jgi:hypothetical protein